MIRITSCYYIFGYYSVNNSKKAKKKADEFDDSHAPLEKFGDKKNEERTRLKRSTFYIWFP